MHRRLFLQRALSVSIASGAILAGCGGGGNTSSVETRALDGTVALPDGVSPADLLAGTGAGIVSARAGAFSVPVLRSAVGPTLAWIQNRDNVVLLGFVDDASARIDAMSTAVALLYFALAGYAASVDSKSPILAALRAHPAAQTLASVIAERISAKLDAVSTGDAAIGDALGEAVEAIRAERTGRAAKVPGVSRGRQVAPVGRMSLTPSEAQSNVLLTQGGESQTFVATNQARRYCQVMAYEIDREDQNGVRANPARAKLVQSVFLPSTPALGFLSTTTGFFSQQTAFTPVSTDPIALSMNVGDAKTFFEIVVLGSSSIVGDPPIFSESRYADQVATWREIRGDLNLSSWLGDVVFGLLLEIWGARDYARINLIDKREAIRGFNTFFFENYLTLSELARSGDLLGATRLAAQTLALDPRLGEGLRVLLINLSPSLQRVLGAGTTAAASKVLVAALRAAMASAGLVLGAGDLGAVLYDLANSEPTERWQASLAVSRLTLTPRTATIAPGDSVGFTASVPTDSGARLAYAWSLSGSNLATLTDTAGGHSGISFETESRAVSLVTTPSTQGTITVTAEAFVVAQNGARSSVGTASSTVTVTDDVPYGKIRVRFTAFDAGGQNVTGETRLLDTYEPARKQVSSGHTFLSSVHWKLKENGSHDDLRMNSEFPTTNLVVGSTASFSDSYGLTLQLATGPNTEIYLRPRSGTMTITELGEGYAKFTMTAELVGLRDVPTTASAILSGWIAGF